MADDQTDPRIDAFQKALSGIRGIRGAKLSTSGRELDSVRALVVPERSAGAAIRDIHAAAKECGLSLDPTQIQVLRAAAIDRTEKRPRRKLSSVATQRSPEGFSSTVSLDLLGDVLIGESEAPVGARGLEHRAVARATLESLRVVLDAPVHLETVYVLQAAKTRYAVVVLEREEDTLVGSAPIRVDEYDAIARATLDAVNRWLTQPEESALQR